MTISLPADPDGNQYEDLVIACLQVLGYFVEPRITLREAKKDILELDVVATPLGGGPRDRTLYEAKKERFSFSNVFKLYGQRTYLGIDNAALVSLRGAEPDYLPVYEAKGADLAVRMCHLPADVTALATLAPPRNLLSDDQRLATAASAWFASIGRTVSHAALLSECKARVGTPALDNARAYVFNSRMSFFQQNPLARAEALYSAYKASPGLAGAAVELVCEELSADDKNIWTAVRDTNKYPWIQAILDAENQGRLAIIKNAFDDYAIRGTLPPPTTTLKLGSLSLNVPLHALPKSFQLGLQSLKAHPHAAKLPYLFQAFYALLGGYLFFNDEGELAFIEALTGVPAAEIQGALRLIDIFFPAATSFFFTAKNEMMAMKMVPAFVRGAGAFVRSSVLELDDYSARYPNMGWLVSRWHNALYNILEPHLKKP
jgi:hypothetical protein